MKKNNKMNLRTILYTVCLMSLSISLLTACSSSTPTPESITYSLTCKSCGRSFSDSANKKSIRSTNMCSNCYKNYSYVKGGKLDNHEHHFDDNDWQILSEFNELSSLETKAG